MDSTSAFHDKLAGYCRQWREDGLPSREALLKIADELTAFRQARNLAGLWRTPPVMLTATLDDAWGNGLALIHRFAEAVGLRIMPLGLLQSPDAIIAACRRHTPEYLGLTMLQFDSEDDLDAIARSLPDRTRLIVGGPVLASDRDLARQIGVDLVAADLRDFLAYLLDQN